MALDEAVAQIVAARAALAAATKQAGDAIAQREEAARAHAAALAVLDEAVAAAIASNPLDVADLPVIEIPVIVKGA